MKYKSRVKKVPIMMQFEYSECGAASLAMILAYHGKWITMEQARVACDVSRDGSTAKHLYLAARNFGLKPSAYRMEPETLLESDLFPCIIHWNMNHFVVLKGVRRSLFGSVIVEINDPARGEVSLSLEEFDHSFTGVVLFFTPEDHFTADGQQKSILSFSMKRLSGAKAAVLFFICVSVLSYFFLIVNNVTARIFIDRILSGKSPGWLPWLIFFISIMTFLQILVSWLQAVYSQKISAKMAMTGATSYMWKVLQLPMQFFSQRMTGDIQARLSLNASIAETLIGTFAPLLLNTVMMIVYLSLMIRQNIYLALVGIAAILLNTFLANEITKQRIRYARVYLRDLGKLEGITFTGISMIETVKSSGAENGFFAKWSGVQATVNDQRMKSAVTEQYLGQLSAMLLTVANSIVLILGVGLIMNRHMTLGVLFMFQGFMNQFTAPAMNLVRAGETIQEMRTRMERIEDVMQYEEDPLLTDVSGPSGAEQQKLSGMVELKNISFGYSRQSDPLIHDFNLCVKSGSKVALVGASGSGKSTISALISGLYQPWSGQILFDGKPRSSYSRDVLAGSVAVVDQNIILFEDTVENNIKMWDRSIKDFEMILAARDADIHEDIIKLSGGYRHSLVAGGRDLSGGQRQQLEIARALAQDPSVLILDEATSALDAKTEARIMESIRGRGITCIVIAHRLSAVRDSDLILVLDNGTISESGTHEELMSLGGIYKELIESE